MQPWKLPFISHATTAYNPLSFLMHKEDVHSFDKVPRGRGCRQAASENVLTLYI